MIKYDKNSKNLDKNVTRTPLHYLFESIYLFISQTSSTKKARLLEQLLLAIQQYGFVLSIQDLTDLREAVSEANKTQELQHSWTEEQIHTLLSTVSNISKRVSSLEHSSDQTTPQSVSNMTHYIQFHIIKSSSFVLQCPDEKNYLALILFNMTTYL